MRTLETGEAGTTYIVRRLGTPLCSGLQEVLLEAWSDSRAAARLAWSGLNEPPRWLAAGDLAYWEVVDTVGGSRSGPGAGAEGGVT